MDTLNSQESLHIPVMLKEALEAIAPRPGGRYLDGTLGLAGHASAILSAAPYSMLCGLDRDEDALAVARKKLLPFGERAKIFHFPFSNFEKALNEMQWPYIDGAMLDLGVSSLQLDSGSRGFSFRASGPLNMRMDRNGDYAGAWDWVNKKSFEELAACILNLGEEPLARKIARAIVNARQAGPINETGRLAEIIENAYPPAMRRKSRRHPATRTFQALRMAVNDELGELKKFLGAIFARLAPGGRLVTITFHSLEDRLVKNAMRLWTCGCICPRSAPVCQCGHRQEARLVFKKPLIPQDPELENNPRARSAKLRAVEKLVGLPQ